MQEKQVAMAECLLFVFGLFWHNYLAEYEYTIRPTIRTEQNIRCSPNYDDNSTLTI